MQTIGKTKQNLVHLLSAKPTAPSEKRFPNRLVDEILEEYRDEAVGTGNRQEHGRLACALRR